MQSTEKWAHGPTITGSIWRFRYLVLIAAILGGSASYLLAQLQEPVYESSTRMFITTPGAAAVFEQRGIDLPRHVAQQAELLASPVVLETAATALDDGSTAAGIAEQVTVDSDADLATLTISVQDPWPRRAADVANAVAEAYKDAVRAEQIERVERATAELQSNAEELQAQIDDLIALAPSDEEEIGLDNQQVAAQIGVLTQRLVEIEALGQQLQVDARVFDTGVEFLEPAAAPQTPVAPRPRLAAAFGLLLATMAASAFAYWRVGRDNRVDSPNLPASMLDAPLLGTLPTYEPPAHVTLAQRTALEPRTLEAYRFVYSSLMSSLRRSGGASVMVSSAGPRTGKTETAIQIAATAARRGQRVLLIDADLRLGGLTQALQAELAPGLSTLATPSERNVREHVIRTYPLDRSHEIDVVTTGRRTRDGEQQLSDSWFGAAFRQLADGYDLTVVDSPPLLAVADSAVIAEHADRVVLVIREGADIGEVERVRQRLDLIEQGRDVATQLLVGYVFLTPSALEGSHLDYGLVRSKSKLSKASARQAQSEVGTNDTAERPALLAQRHPDRG